METVGLKSAQSVGRSVLNWVLLSLVTSVATICRSVVIFEESTLIVVLLMFGMTLIASPM
ncbi:MAG: hypothetical protein WAN47_08435 [Nitrosotalea sp.]